MSRPPAPRRSLSLPHPERLGENHPAREEILNRHELAMALGQSGYKDPITGNFVFTAKELSNFEHCCAMECRHCPFKR
jgi:hypothetical protein